MKDPAITIQERTRLYQLIALGFVHPVQEFHDQLVSDHYSSTVNDSVHSLFGIDPLIGCSFSNFEGYEADYINLFQVGRGGKPRVHLNAGEYSKLIEGKSRPEFLLEYSSWYKHFGLKTSVDQHSNELSDHITCQFEFLTWLTHLESQAIDQVDLLEGYRCAQRDFCQRHLSPFMSLLLTALKRESQEQKNGIVRASPFFLELASLSAAVVTQTVSHLVAVVGEASDQPDQLNEISVVNLWN